ncbi:hypothetical protein G5V59_26820 [Nocardioides sp. W3-2-3]|uniref:hypothetical protein n=1 Tax=Nocardioides convexus TaxID=2712224 RepID=UPI002418A77F|nr:hypothetical protein [Nocardioides convexus]NHA02006.1 hypothetical protein [Nocardioides convexus]
MSTAPAVKTIDQTIFAGDPTRKGNCVAACIATVVGAQAQRGPPLHRGGSRAWVMPTKESGSGNAWWAMMLGFLAGRGLWAYELDSPADAEPGELVLVAGPSPRGVLHQVIFRDGELWHDPHPSRDGVLDVVEVLAVRPLSGFDHAPTRATRPTEGAVDA